MTILHKGAIEKWPNIFQQVACISHTDLSDMSIVGTCDILVYKSHHQVMWFVQLVDSILLSIYVVTCHWNHFYDLAMCKNFQNCFSEENIIILSLNTVMPIIVMVWLSKMTQCLHRRIFLFVWFVAFRPKSTAMVMVGRSVHVTTLFPGQLEQAVNQYFVHILSLVTDIKPSWMIQRKGGEWP